VQNWGEDILQSTMGVSLNKDSSDIGIVVVTFILQNPVKSAYSLTETFINTPRSLLKGRLTISLITYW